MFRTALFNATYKNGRPGTLTPEHEAAEHHAFKIHHLFKEKAIPKDVYVLRLIQHYIIINAMESQLKELSEHQRSELNPFFCLSYLSELWRADGIVRDMKALDVDPEHLDAQLIARSTRAYVQQLARLNPKELLAHYLLHISGFMHGGKILEKKYLEPSNALTSYQITSFQYDFSSITQGLERSGWSTMDVFNDLMNTVDRIELTNDELEALTIQCKSVYSTVSQIYDNLIQIRQDRIHPKESGYTVNLQTLMLAFLLLISACLAAFSSISKNSSPEQGNSSAGPGR